MIHDDKPPLDIAYGAFLEHHGIKGMKWGVRRGRSGRSGSSTGTKRSRKVVPPLPKMSPEKKAKLAKAGKAGLHIAVAASGHATALNVLHGVGHVTSGDIHRANQKLYPNDDFVQSFLRDMQTGSRIRSEGRHKSGF